MKKNLQALNWAQKSLVTLFSMLLTGFAMAGMISSDLGADSFTLFIGGLSRVAGIGEGTATNLANIFLFLFCLFFNRRRIRGATLICALASGPCVDAGAAALARLFPHPLSPAGRLGVGAASCVLLGLGVGLYLALDFGAAPLDGFVLWLQDVTRLRYRTCTWAFNLVLFAVGIALGGTLGPVTLLGLLVPGAVADVLLTRLGPPRPGPAAP